MTHLCFPLSPLTEESELILRGEIGTVDAIRAVLLTNSIQVVMLLILLPTGENFSSLSLKENSNLT